MLAFGGSIWDVLTSDTMYSSTVRFATLIAFAAIGEWVAEKSGTMNISVEGMILTGAFTSALGSHWFHNAPLAVLVGLVGGVLVAAVQANMAHRLGANQFVVALTLNVLAVGLTAFVDAQVRPKVTRLTETQIPLLSKIPLVGDALFDRPWIVYLLYPLIPLAWFIVYRTRWGLEIRSCGENPQAADVSGIHVNKRRRQSIYVCGMFAGLAGAYLTIGQSGSFGADGVAGRGYLALAAVIFGGWTLKGTIAGALVFGVFQALGSAYQALGYSANPSLLTALPYLMALTTLLLFAYRSRQPASLGRPFVRGLT